LNGNNVGCSFNSKTNFAPYTGTFAKMVGRIGPCSQFHQLFLRGAFPPFYFHQKITNPNCKHIKASKTLSYKKAAFKMLVKLTPSFYWLPFATRAFFYSMMTMTNWESIFALLIPFSLQDLIDKFAAEDGVSTAFTFSAQVFSSSSYCSVVLNRCSVSFFFQLSHFQLKFISSSSVSQPVFQASSKSTAMFHSSYNLYLFLNEKKSEITHLTCLLHNKT